MNMNKSPIPPFPAGKIDKNYSSGNKLIRMFLNRLLTRIALTLTGIGAGSVRGLEVGCGEGNIIHYLHNRDVIGDLIAVDLQIEKLRFAKHNVPHASYLTADITHLIFKDSTFDYIMAIEMFEHLPEPANALNELHRVAKKGAYLLISVPHEPFFHWGNMARGKYLDRMGRTPSHVNFWNRKQFKQFLSKNVNILEEHYLTTFPWLFYLCQFSTTCGI